MNDKKIKTPEELKNLLEAVREEIRQIRERADKDVWAVYENARKIFDEHGAGIPELAELEERAADPVRDLLAESAAMRRELEEAADEARELAPEVHAEALRDFHERGSDRIQGVADQHGLSWIEAAEKYGNALAPKPPDLVRRPALGPDDPDSGDTLLFGFTVSDARELATERGITLEEAARMISRRNQPEPREGGYDADDEA